MQSADTKPLTGRPTFSRAFWITIVVLLAILLAPSFYQRLRAPTLSPWGSLMAYELPASSEGPHAERALVFLHGFAEHARDGADVAVALREGFPARYVVPQGPIESEGAPGWTWFHWRQAEGGVIADEAERDAARAGVLAIIARLRAEGASQVFIGGFSEGARLAMDVALAADPPVDGVLFFSGASMDSWQTERAAGLPVFMSHGTRDAILSYDNAEAIRAHLQGRGARVTFFPFEGPHRVAPAIPAALEFLLALGSRDSRASAAPPVGSGE